MVKMRDLKKAPSFLNKIVFNINLSIGPISTHSCDYLRGRGPKCRHYLDRISNCHPILGQGSLWNDQEWPRGGGRGFPIWPRGQVDWFFF